MNKALFLDRDGVINEVVFRNGEPSSPRKIEEFIVEQSTINIINECSKEYLIFIVSNQPDVKRGKIDIKELVKMNILLYVLVLCCVLLYCTIFILYFIIFCCFLHTN